MLNGVIGPRLIFAYSHRYQLLRDVLPSMRMSACARALSVRTVPNAAPSDSTPDVEESISDDEDSDDANAAMPACTICLASYEAEEVVSFVCTLLRLATFMADYCFALWYGVSGVVGEFC